MLRKALLALVLVLGSSSAWAQNTTCSDRPQSDNSNACANTRFVKSAATDLKVGITGIIGGTNGAPLYNNAGVLGNGLIASTWTTYTGYEATASRTVQSKLQDQFSILDYIGSTGCIPGNYTTNCSAALAAAIQAAADYAVSGGVSQGLGGVTVFIPAVQGCYRLATTIAIPQGISIVGVGGLGSCLLFDNVDAFTYTFPAQYGQQQLSGLFLYGCKYNVGTTLCDAPTLARTAIKRVQTTGNSTTDRMLGLALQNLLVWGFDTGIDVTTVGNLWITNSYFQRVNTCAKINGLSFGVRFQGFQCTFDGGDGLGTRGDAIVASGYTYTTPAATQGPEALEINNSDILDFNRGVRLNLGNVATITNSTFQTRIAGIQFLNWGLGLQITNNYFLSTNAAVQAAIFGEGAANTTTQTVNIRDNVFESTGSGTNNAIQINEAGLFGVHDVNVVNNRTTGFTGRDLYVFGPNKVTAEGNNFGSTGTVASIEFTSATVFINFITRNTAAVSIVTNATDLTLGSVRKCDNIVAGVREECTWVMTTNNSTANRLMLGGGAGLQPTALTAGTTTTVLHGNAGGAPTFGAVANADLTNSSTTVNGQTCTLGSTCTVVAAATSIAVGSTTITTGTTGGLLFNNSAVLGNTVAGTNGQFLLGVTGGAPNWGTMSGDATTTNAGVITISNNAITLAKLATQATNTILGNATSGSAVPTALAIGSCSTASSALIWTTNTGFGCNTSITAAAVPASGLTGATLAAGVTASSLTSLGTIASFNVTQINGFALGGTISGGGNQINNVIIGTATPLAGFFTTLSATTSVTSPIHGATSSLVFQSNAGTVAGTIDTSQRWSVGTQIPVTGVTFDINQTSAATAYPGSSLPGLRVLSTGSTTDITLQSYGVGGNNYSGYAAGGTAGVPAALTSGTIINALRGVSYDNAAWGNAGGANVLVSMRASQLQAVGAHGTEIAFGTTPNGTTARADAMIVQNSGGVSIGTTTDPLIGGLQVNGQSFFPNAAADTATVDSTACIATTGGKLLKGTGTLGICLGTSGRQFKTAFEPMAAGLDEITKLPLWNYRYLKGFGDSGARMQYGSTAQDVDAILPDLVRHDTSGEAINYDIGALLPISLRAIQQLNERMVRLENQR